MHLKEELWEDVDWIYQDQDENLWCAYLNKVMDLQVSRKVGNIYVTECQLTSQDSLCAMDLAK
jgi:hypothetical protein